MSSEKASEWSTSDRRHMPFLLAILLQGAASACEHQGQFIRGRVVGGMGEPLPEVVVREWLHCPGTAPTTQIRELLTDKNGEFAYYAVGGTSQVFRNIGVEKEGYRSQCFSVSKFTGLDGCVDEGKQIPCYLIFVSMEPLSESSKQESR